jgi:putative hydrolase of the HAD superfamily
MSQQTLDSGEPRVPEDVRAVFFDLAGTLIQIRGGLGHQYAAIAREFGIDPDPRVIESVFVGAFQAAGPMLPSDLGPGPGSGLMSNRPVARGGVPGDGMGELAPLQRVAAAERAFWKDVVRLVCTRLGAGMTPSTFDRYFDRLFDHFATADAWDIYPDVERTLDRLERAGFILGLITNFDQRAIPLLHALGLDRFFPTVVIPARAGAAKPGRVIFEYALAQHGLGPREAVQVGDSPEDDVAGARAAGLNAVLLDRQGRYVGGEPTAIRSLDELPRRLGLER